MKREICCPSCADGWKRAMGWNGTCTPGKFPGVNIDGEGMRQVPGAAAIDCRCDGCGADLPAGSKAVAVSVYATSTPYFAWEAEFIVQAVDSARGALRGGLVIDGLSRHTSEKTGAVIVGEPKVTMVILEDR